MTIEAVIARQSWWVIVGLALLATTSCNAEGGPDPRVSPLVLDVPPPGLEVSVALDLPDEFPSERPELNLRLLERTVDSSDGPSETGIQAGAIVGVFAPLEGDTWHDSLGAPGFSEDVGPDGLNSWILDGCSPNKPCMVVGRLSEAELASIAAIAEHGILFEDSDWRFIGEQSPSAFPGTGSIPSPPRTRGYAVSYIGYEYDLAGFETQRSIVLAAYAAVGSDALAFDWWYGAHGVKTGPWKCYSFPSYEQVGPGEVPRASLCTEVQQGVVRIVRLSNVDEAKESAVIASVRWATDSEWKRLKAESD